MRRYVFQLAILSLAALGTSAARADDQQIAQQIVERLKAEKQAGSLKGFSIDLQVDEGTVWLSGRVANPQQEAKALDIARRVPGVQQVVNDLSIAPAARPTAAAAPMPTMNQYVTSEPASQTKSAPQPISPANNSMLNSVGKALVSAVHGPAVESAPRMAVQPVSASQDYAAAATPIGAGVDPAAASTRRGVVQAAQPMPNMNPGYADPYQGMAPAGMPQGMVPAPMPGQYMAAVPVYAGSRSQVPLAMAPARPVNYDGVAIPADGAAGPPVPMYMPGSGVGIAPARYDHPSMPGYAWPSYAAYPNYAAVTYPKQYSPTAWPYIGPFYPYPQVPLGWRKVTLEWDDGWWMLDFKDRRTMYNH